MAFSRPLAGERKDEFAENDKNEFEGADHRVLMKSDAFAVVLYASVANTKRFSPDPVNIYFQKIFFK